MIFYILLELHRNGGQEPIRMLTAYVRELPELADAIGKLPETVSDSLWARNELFLDVTEKHKMVVENAGLLTVAALHHLDCKGQNVVSVLSGGNMDVITMSSLVQHGLINRGRIFTFSVQLPDRPGELLRVAKIVAEKNGNIIKLDHNQFVNINRQSGVELKVTLEAFGHEHKQEILDAMRQAGYDPHLVLTQELYST